ncbi:YbaN family protein [Enterovirga sp. GCM10030262]|uniref:YbaN family protein n=1 Tax=Enterovirga sp. GCM10030262 TaxID=3273391 RepID=UPI00361FE46D
MLKPISSFLGIMSLALGAVGLFLPLLPTVPFVLLAAFFLSKGSPRLERWLLRHRQFGPPIRAWRDSGSISPAGKRGAYATFALSALAGILLLAAPWGLLPLAAAVAGSAWIYRRPEQ